MNRSQYRYGHRFWVGADPDLSPFPHTAQAHFNDRPPGRKALVTGGARGIGAAIADRYAAEGARVAIADISLAYAEETAARYGDKAVAIALDVTKTASIEAAVENVVQRWGGVDILVNNAGIFDMVRSSR